MIRIQHDDFSVQAVLDHLRGDGVGGVALFVGTVRGITGEQQTIRLEYETYEEMALAEMSTIREEVLGKFPITDAVLLHRVGTLDVGENIVLTASSAPHRADAFAAAQYLIDTLKLRVPIWKKEFTADGSFWVDGCRLADPSTG